MTKAPFPYFGGKSLATSVVWAEFGIVKNYVEPFVGSAAMLLGSPNENRIETINDFDGMISNFWRSIKHDPGTVAYHADWPINEADLFARHSWLTRQNKNVLDQLHADPEWYDAKIAGWWVWGMCSWIGDGWCSGKGPWIFNEGHIVDSRKLPKNEISYQGVTRGIPHLGDSGQGINRKLKSNQKSRYEFIYEWFDALHHRLRDVRVTCGDWSRVLTDSVTTRHGLTAVFLDPPYTKGNMDYGAGGMGLGIADDVQKWCILNGNNPNLRIVLCGHAGEHDILLKHGWYIKKWKARKGYALTDKAVNNSASETLWCSPYCIGKNDADTELCPKSEICGLDVEI
jgi:site-specific DNA-adenine methylase